MTQVTANGNTYSDDGTTPKDMGNGGFRDHLLPMLRDTVAEVGNAVAARDAAQEAAATAANAPGTSATSTTSVAIGVGSKTLTLAQTGKLFALGQTVVIASTASPANWMAGTITAFNSATGAMTVNVSHIAGSGTLAAWTVSLSGPAGVTGLLNERAGANIASAATVNLDTATGNFIHITGTTAISTFTLAQGAERTLVFDGVLTLTHGANLILPTAANIVTAPGDVVIIRGEAGTVSRVVAYLGADGLPAGYRNGHMNRTAVTVAASTIDCATGVRFLKVVNGAVAFTLANVPAGEYTCILEIELTSGSISFTNNVDFEQERAPQMATGKRHLLCLTTRDGGAQFLCSYLRNFALT